MADPNKPDTFDDRFGFVPRPPTGDPSVDAILPPYVPAPQPQPPGYGEGEIIPSPTPPILSVDPNVVVPIPVDNPLDARAQDQLPTAEPTAVPTDQSGAPMDSLPPLPTGNPNPYVESPAYESHGGVDYSGRPSSLAEAFLRGSVDVNSMTQEQLERVQAELAANPELANIVRSSRRG